MRELSLDGAHRRLQLEEQPLLDSGRTHLHEALITHDEVVEHRLDPVRGIGREAIARRRSRSAFDFPALAEIETLQRLDQANLAFLEEISFRHAVARHLLDGFQHQAPMRQDDPIAGTGAPGLLEGLNEFAFFLGTEVRRGHDLGEDELVNRFEYGHHDTSQGAARNAPSINDIDLYPYARHNLPASVCRG
ncbi:hypothetical protein BO1005MUT1_530314 [Hyphomicrobiales bacterium]|nr:hypothetical protein BO1005MUT1_530314 [Hyphomicrobiales bacterium]